MVNKYDSESKIKKEFFYKIAIASLLIMSFIISFILFEIIFLGYYTTIVTMIYTGVSYGITSFLVLFLSILFFLWYRINKSMVIFMFLVSMVLISTALAITLVETILKINERPSEIFPFIGGSMDISVGNYSILEQAYKIFSVVAVISLWIVTVLLSVNFKDRLSRASKNWIILTIPITYYLLISFHPFVFYDLLKLLSNYILITSINQSIIFTAIMTLSNPITGILFGTIIWRTARNLGYEKKISMYMTLSGWGIFLLFLTGQESLQILSPFPPFGLITYGAQIISSYLVLFGLYNSARLISMNQQLRTLIYKETISSKLLGVIGEAETTIEVTRVASKVMMKCEEPKLSRENPDLDLEELKDYIISLKTELKGDSIIPL